MCIGYGESGSQGVLVFVVATQKNKTNVNTPASLVTSNRHADSHTPSRGPMSDLFMHGHQPSASQRVSCKQSCKCMSAPWYACHQVVCMAKASCQAETPQAAKAKVANVCPSALSVVHSCSALQAHTFPLSQHTFGSPVS